MAENGEQGKNDTIAARLEQLGIVPEDFANDETGPNKWLQTAVVGGFAVAAVGIASIAMMQERRKRAKSEMKAFDWDETKALFLNPDPNFAEERQLYILILTECLTHPEGLRAKELDQLVHERFGRYRRIGNSRTNAAVDALVSSKVITQSQVKLADTKRAATWLKPGQEFLQAVTTDSDGWSGVREAIQPYLRHAPWADAIKAAMQPDSSGATEE